jgi:hypothetical protein
MRVSSITNRQQNRNRYSVHLLDSIGNQLILTAYTGPDRYPRELYHYTIDANGVIIKRIIASTSWAGEITVSNPTFDYHVVTLTAEHEVKNRS